ncbi:MAG: hypothetical protein CVV53_02665 [Spirochaetae bacterium HGW-Spirochaetae-9]|nr:MAG: hypothetical protein CVV53_02665 [Spirochaetae bacterium HGW-Spirochaetae-9]
MKASLLFLAAMELMKLHLLAYYLFFAFGKSVPFAAASFGFFLALALSRFLRRKGMRVVFFAFFELLGFSIFFMTLYASYNTMATNVSSTLKSNGEAITFMSLLIVGATFWLRAAWLEVKKPDHEFYANRFDEGIALFLAAFCIVAVLRVDALLPGRLVIPFFIFGMLALGLAKSETAQRGGLAPTARRTMVISATAVFFLAAAAVLLVVPALTEPARKAAESLKNASFSLLQLIASILSWLFRAGPPKFAAQREEGRQLLNAPPVESDGSSPFSVILMWAFLGIAGIFVAILFGYLLIGLFRFLASRTKKPVDDRGGRSFSDWLKAVWGALATALSRMAKVFARMAENARRRRGYSPALAAYARLATVGKAAGIPRLGSETPREYARRLAASCPDSAGQAAFIAEAVEREVYGGLAGDAPTDARLKRSRNGLSSAAFIMERARMATRKVRESPVSR